MDTESIRTFLVLARTRNYTRAADQLFVAQSTVTNRINELEKELGFMLFTRTNRSVELTVKGEQFISPRSGCMIIISGSDAQTPYMKPIWRSGSGSIEKHIREII